MKSASIILLFLLSFSANAQTNTKLSSQELRDILLENKLVEPSSYNNLNLDKSQIVNSIKNDIQSDSLKEYIVKLSTFKTRHTSSDTLSTTSGIGAARRWAHSKFEEFIPRSNGRLTVGYMSFEQDVCGVTFHKNTIAVLPGADTNSRDIIIIEGHLDSRCDSRCDITCTALGVEDNATGSALVLELARVLSKSVFNKTIVFMLTTGEEQGLNGATAFAKYCKKENIEVAAVLNNDVIGSITCGKTASPPGCPGENELDSTQVRIFSYGSYNSPHKALARYSKLQYNNELKSTAEVPMTITIMSAEDRTGRGGDHIPFRSNGFAAVRFTSANEHGDASNGPDYTDRQHTENDVLGIDRDKDGAIDSFFVNFDYLKRNAQINAISAIEIAKGVPIPDADLSLKWGHNVEINIKDKEIAPWYLLGVRSLNNDFDTLIVLKGAQKMDAWVPDTKNLFISLAAVNNEHTESLFTSEQRFKTLGVKEQQEEKNVQLLTNIPNPFDESTIISIFLNEDIAYDNARVIITDITGKTLKNMPISLHKGSNEVVYTHGYGTQGILYCTLFIDGKIQQTTKMLFSPK